MKKALFVFSALVVSLLSFAQQSPKVSEVGLVFSNLDQFGFTYRVGSVNAVWRVNALSVSGISSFQEQVNYTHSISRFGYGISLGREYRAHITKLVDFRYGADISYTYLKTTDETNELQSTIITNITNQTSNLPGCNLVLGLNFKLHHFIVGAELNPGFKRSTVIKDITQGSGNPVQQSTTEWTYDLSNTPVLLSVVYQF